MWALLSFNVFLLIFYNVDLAEIEELLRTKCTELKRPEVEAHLSTKTPYRVVANLDDAPWKYAGCSPKRMWSIIRHGTRNPSKEIIQSAQQRLTQFKENILNNNNSKLCPEDLERLRKWHFNVSFAEEKFLVPEGEDELIELAERMQNRFPDILPDSYDPHLYYFKYTATQRTLKSAHSFATGLFGRDRVKEIIYPEALHKDPVLRVSNFNENIISYV